MQICNSAETSEGETSEWEDMSDEEAVPDSEEEATPDSENAVASNSEKQVSSNSEHTGVIVENVN